MIKEPNDTTLAAFEEAREIRLKKIDRTPSEWRPSYEFPADQVIMSRPYFDAIQDSIRELELKTRAESGDKDAKEILRLRSKVSKLKAKLKKEKRK